jgi:predicted lipoprotein with Yx(FWY)xxD motif
MRFMRLTRAVFVSAAALAVVVTALLPATASPVVKPPVSTFSDPTFGRVLSRRDKQVLYYWSVEKRAGGKVKCVRSCAIAWPPLIVKSRSAVPRRIAGISGVFGTIRRPNGQLQATRNGLALYTYAHERPRQVLCNDVNGWFVVRVR